MTNEPSYLKPKDTPWEALSLEAQEVEVQALLKRAKGLESQAMKQLNDLAKFPHMSEAWNHARRVAYAKFKAQAMRCRSMAEHLTYAMDERAYPVGNQKVQEIHSI